MGGFRWCGGGAFDDAGAAFGIDSRWAEESKENSVSGRNNDVAAVFGGGGVADKKDDDDSSEC